MSAPAEERVVQPEHLLWLLNAPDQVGSPPQSALEEVRAGGAICHAPASSGNDVSDGVVHRLSSLSVSFVGARMIKAEAHHVCCASMRCGFGQQTAIHEQVLNTQSTEELMGLYEDWAADYDRRERKLGLQRP